MEISEYRPSEVPYLIDRLRREGTLLAAAAEAAGLDAPVPSCPGWRVRDLLKHLGYVHRWAAGYVQEQRADPVDSASEEDILRAGPDDESLPGWFREGHAHLVQTLAEADADMTCWTFLASPSAQAFWARRQAHETAIHRVDAEQAAAAVQAGASGAVFPAEFAADGVDELIMGFLVRNVRRGWYRGPQGSLLFHARDAGAAARWRIAAVGDQVTVERGNGPADCEVSGPAAGLYLVLWNRAPADDIAVAGDSGLLAAFLETFHVTWR